MPNAFAISETNLAAFSHIESGGSNWAADQHAHPRQHRSDGHQSDARAVSAPRKAANAPQWQKNSSCAVEPLTYSAGEVCEFSLLSVLVRHVIYVIYFSTAPAHPSESRLSPLTSAPIAKRLPLRNCSSFTVTVLQNISCVPGGSRGGAMMLAASTPRPAGLLPVRHRFTAVLSRISFAHSAIAQHAPAPAKFEPLGSLCSKSADQACTVQPPFPTPAGLQSAKLPQGQVVHDISCGACVLVGPQQQLQVSCGAPHDATKASWAAAGSGGGRH